MGQARSRARLAGFALMVAALLLQQTVDAASAPKRLKALPPSILGLWAYEPADCGNPDSDGHLTIEAKTVLFFASGYDIKRIVQRPDGSWRASGSRSDEGEAGRTRDSLTLKLVAPDQLHVITGGPEGHVYHRCKAPPPGQK
ncbi:hypothetical protein [Pseudorhodoplanes sinuspersici]|uniref:Uncharacterized protein n=1 Tax=Pseudorhodoplanes sinuspersici TaxID=1235591 RepID=A0A1W6ZVB6_9HYPH|nr:hypothetical protein [Pseudorhodoplanes sinuspersici]ARQ01218.1 hypothetical protein CAK95_20545 [Pseudorhodoplanes sinuspersici]RKE72883.1 hypothetical protein DFP91_0756 [Pseudorhodoplanes sinuspersici]